MRASFAILIASLIALSFQQATQTQNDDTDYRKITQCGAGATFFTDHYPTEGLGRTGWAIAIAKSMDYLYCQRLYNVEYPQGPTEEQKTLFTKKWADEKKYLPQHSHYHLSQCCYECRENPNSGLSDTTAQKIKIEVPKFIHEGLLFSVKEDRPPKPASLTQLAQGVVPVPVPAPVPTATLPIHPPGEPKACLTPPYKYCDDAMKPECWTLMNGADKPSFNKDGPYCPERCNVVGNDEYVEKAVEYEMLEILYDTFAAKLITEETSGTHKAIISDIVVKYTDAAFLSNTASNTASKAVISRITLHSNILDHKGTGLYKCDTSSRFYGFVWVRIVGRKKVTVDGVVVESWVVVPPFGKSFGDNGAMYIQNGVNECGIESEAIILSL